MDMTESAVPEFHLMPVIPLSRRECEVLPLIVAGKTNNQIAEELVISPETVKSHVGSILAKYASYGTKAELRDAIRAHLQP